MKTKIKKEKTITFSNVFPRILINLLLRPACPVEDVQDESTDVSSAWVLVTCQDISTSDTFILCLWSPSPANLYSSNLSSKSH